IGRVLTDREAGDLIRLGVTAVLDLTAEFTEPARLRALHYRNLPILDLTAPTMAQLRDAVVFIDEQLAGGGTVYVHCKVGYSRTAAMVGAYLMASGACKTVDAAMMHLRAARPPIVIRPEAVAAMQQFCQARLPP
ncbi:MAG: dual specificity protein phosphatase family protein, partial [Verrucomicrobia bacterium]|nr:dual specificity protein phosphatase family protein [Verrucomicrobiota bacterium]